MKRIFKIAVKTLGVLFAFMSILSTVVVVILNWPGLILDVPLLNRILPYLAKSGVVVTWDTAAIKTESRGFIRESVTFSFINLCWTLPEQPTSCLKELEGRIGYRLSGLKIYPDILGPLRVRGESVFYKASDPKKEVKKTSFPIPQIKIPDWLSETEFHPVDIDFPRVTITQGEQVFEGNLKIEVVSTPAFELEKGTLIGSFSRKGTPERVEFELPLTSASHFTADDWVSDGSLSFRLSNLAGKMNLKVSKISEDTLAHEVVLKLEGKGEFQATGTVSNGEVATRVTGVWANPGKGIDSVTLPSCEINLKKRDESENEGDLTLNCPVDVRLKKFRLPVAGKTVAQTPEGLTLQVKAQAKTFYYPDMSKPIEGDMSIRLSPLDDGLVSSKGEITARFKGIPSQFPEDWELMSKLSVDFSILRLARFISIFEGTPYAVWAPFHTLDGRVTLNVQGDLSRYGDIGKYVLQFETRLSSPGQKVDIDMKGESVLHFPASGRSGTFLKSEITLSQVLLELPTFSIAPLPRFIPDRRIQTETKKLTQPPLPLPFHYEVRVKTAENKPIRFKSNFSSVPIPVHLDVLLKDGQKSGQIRFGDFPLTLFHRTVNMKKFQFTLAQPMDLSGVSGALAVNYADYDILVRLMGTVKRPRVIFESNPPLSEEEIIAVLVYGEPFGELDEDEAASVGGAGAALADRALSLWTLYFFSATPIQRFSYNPQTKAVSAKLKLGKGTAFYVGSTDKDYQLGLRKRFGNGWMINTTVETPSDEGKTKGGAFLEWHKRY